MPLPITAQFKSIQTSQDETARKVLLQRTTTAPTNATNVTLTQIELIGVGADVVAALPPGTTVTISINTP